MIVPVAYLACYTENNSPLDGLVQAEATCYRYVPFKCICVCVRVRACARIYACVVCVLCVCLCLETFNDQWEALERGKSSRRK